MTIEANEAAPEVSYPLAGVGQAELEAWIEDEIGRRVERSILEATQRVEFTAQKMADGTNDSTLVYQCRGVWVLKVFVMNLIEVLNTAGAKNCLELTIKPADDFHPVKILIIRPRGRTPLEMMADLRQRVKGIGDLIEERK